LLEVLSPKRAFNHHEENLHITCIHKTSIKNSR
jgi:hypothetical protein